MLRDQIIKEKENIDILCQNYGVSLLGIFGSVARGKESENSDIDLYIQFKKPAKSYFEQYELSQELKKMFGREIDLVTNPKTHIIDNLVKDFINLYDTRRSP